MASLLFSLSSCFELKESIYVTKNGSGRYEMLLDFSANREVLKDLMAQTRSLPNFWQQGTPDEQLKTIFKQQSEQLDELSGVYNSKPVIDNEAFKYGIRFSFVDISSLNEGLKVTSNWQKKKGKFYTYSSKKLKRNNVFNLEDLTEKLQTGLSENTGNQAFLEEIYEQAEYHWTLQIEQDVKAISNDSTSLSEDRHQVSFNTKLKFVKEGNINLKNTIKW